MVQALLSFTGLDCRPFETNLSNTFPKEWHALSFIRHVLDASSRNQRRRINQKLCGIGNGCIDPGPREFHSNTGQGTAMTARGKTRQSRSINFQRRGCTALVQTSSLQLRDGRIHRTERILERLQGEEAPPKEAWNSGREGEGRRSRNSSGKRVERENTRNRSLNK